MLRALCCRQGARLKRLFEATQDHFQRRPAASRARVLSAYGHTHGQACHGRDGDGVCNLILSGGGGGCCKGDLAQNHAGFTSVHLTEDGGFTTDVEGVEVRLKWGNCSW